MRIIMNLILADIQKDAELLYAMGNAKRLHILQLLSKNEISVTDLAAMVGLSQSALSQHLAKLRAAGLVSTRRERQTIFYACHSPCVNVILSALESRFFESADTD